MSPEQIQRRDHVIADLDAIHTYLTGTTDDWNELAAKVIHEAATQIRKVDPRAAPEITYEQSMDLSLGNISDHQEDIADHLKRSNKLQEMQVQVLTRLANALEVLAMNKYDSEKINAAAHSKIHTMVPRA